MKALLLGGTGTIGAELAQTLSVKGWDVYVTTRYTHANYHNIHYIVGDAMNLNFLKSILCQRWDVIVDFMIYSCTQFKERYLSLLRNTGQYIFLSSARVYAECSSLISESSPRILDVCTNDKYLQTDEYALSKARQENMLLNSGVTNWTIARPYITFGPTRLQLGILEKEEWLYRALNRRAIVVCREVNDKITTLTSNKFVSQAITCLCGKPHSLGEIFNITSDMCMKWEQALEIYISGINEKMGFKPAIHNVGLVKFDRITARSWQLQSDRCYDRRFDNRKIRSVYTEIPAPNCFVELRNALHQFLEKPKFGAINWLVEARQDTITKEIPKLCEFKSIRSLVQYVKHRQLITNLLL